MGRLWNKWLVPALFAVILFLCIRVANDILDFCQLDLTD